MPDCSRLPSAPCEYEHTSVTIKANGGAISPDAAKEMSGLDTMVIDSMARHPGSTATSGLD